MFVKIAQCKGSVSVLTKQGSTQSVCAIPDPKTLIGLECTGLASVGGQASVGHRLNCLQMLNHI